MFYTIGNFRPIILACPSAFLYKIGGFTCNGTICVPVFFSRSTTGSREMLRTCAALAAWGIFVAMND